MSELTREQVDKAFLGLYQEQHIKGNIGVTTTLILLQSCITQQAQEVERCKSEKNDAVIELYRKLDAKDAELAASQARCAKFEAIVRDHQNGACNRTIAQLQATIAARGGDTMSLVKYVNESHLRDKPFGKTICGDDVPVIPLADLTELANGLRTIVGHAHDGAVLPKQQLHGEVFVTYDGVGLTLTVEHDPHRAPSQRIYLDRDAIGQLHALLMAVAAS